MRILFVQKRPCLPANNGAKIRTSQVVTYLTNRHHLCYVSNINQSEEEISGSELMQKLGVRTDFVPWSEPKRGSLYYVYKFLLSCATRYPFNAFKDYHGPLRQRIQKLVLEERFDVLICDFAQTALNVIGVREIPKILFTHNVEWEIFDRLSQRATNPIMKAVWAQQARKMAKYEQALGHHFEAIVAVSERDKEIFQEKYGWSHLYTIDTGVDTDYFSPTDSGTVPGKIVFVGGLDWPPNVDGLVEFVRHCWPTIRASFPTATLDIVGRNPISTVKKLSEVPGVDVIGSVPDVRPYWGRAEVAIVPLRAGGGTRLKIPEALAMGKAVVTTSIGVEGLRLNSGEHLLVADDPQDFASAVVRLLTDAHLRSQLAQAGSEWVRNHFGADKVGRQFENICEAVVRSATSRCERATDACLTRKQR